MPFKIRSAKCVARVILVADKRDQTLNVPVIVPHSAVFRLRLVGNKTQMVFRLHLYLYNCGFIASAYSMG